MRSALVVLVAVAAGVLGVIAGLVANGPGPLLGTEVGQRVVNRTYTALTPVPEGVRVPRVGEAVAELALPRLAGGTLALPSAFAGRPLLVNVWASWCGPCIEEMPELQRYAQAQGTQGVQVVGVALDDADAVRAFLHQVPVSYPIAFDAPGPRDAGVLLGNPKGALPYTVLIGPDGRILRQKIGPFVHGEVDGWAQPTP